MSGTDVILKIASLLKNSIEGLAEKDFKDLMQQQYQKIRLIDAAGNWQSDVFANFTDDLLPGNLLGKDIVEFIDLIASLACDNSYLVNALEQLSKHQYSDLSNRVNVEGTQVFREVIAYALIQERLTKAQRNDWRVLEECSRIWKNVRNSEEGKRILSAFDKAKLASVERGITAIVRYHKSRTTIVPTSFLSVLLPVNIIEAIFEDYTHGFKVNAKAAWILLKNRPGRKSLNPKTGAGPSVWSEDGKTILIRMPLPKQWADLYTSWNLAFVSKYDSFPYKMVKLLIPQVNNYKDSPSEYIYNRALALYTHLHFSYLGGDIKLGDKFMQWNNDDITTVWAQENAISSRHYQDAVSKRSR